MKKDERFYAAVQVSDVSAFLKVPKYKQAPSMPTMLLLEQDTRSLGASLYSKRDNYGEFPYSNQYIDSQFDLSDGVDRSQQNYEKEDARLNALLDLQKTAITILSNYRGLPKNV